MLKTRAFQIAKTAKFFPTYSTIPTITHEDNLVIAAQELIKALQQQDTKNQNIFTPLKQNVLKQLSDIFNEATGSQKVTDVPANTSALITTAPLKVKNPILQLRGWTKTINQPVHMMPPHQTTSKTDLTFTNEKPDEIHQWKQYTKATVLLNNF